MHTPLPWKVEDCCIWGGSNFQDYVAYIRTGLAKETSEANGEMIVKAVNSHEELLEALRSIASAIGTVERNVEPCGLGNIRRVALAAIKKASGE